MKKRNPRFGATPCWTKASVVLTTAARCKQGGWVVVDTPVRRYGVADPHVRRRNARNEVPKRHFVGTPRTVLIRSYL